MCCLTFRLFITLLVLIFADVNYAGLNVFIVEFKVLDVKTQHDGSCVLTQMVTWTIECIFIF